MPRFLDYDLFSMPSIRRFIDAVADDLADQRNVLLLLPETVTTETVCDCLFPRLDQRGFHSCRTVLSLSDPLVGPGEALVECLGLTWPDRNQAFRPSTVFLALASGSYESLPDVVLVEAVEDLQKDYIRRWVSFLEDWAKMSQAPPKVDQPMPRICLITRGSTITGPSILANVRLAIRYWWGLPSLIETRLLCRLSVRASQSSPLDQWREHVLPAVVGSDISIAEEIWNCIDQDAGTIMERLRHWADANQWTRQKLASWGFDRWLQRHYSEASPGTPPAYVYDLWAHGVMSYSVDYGIEPSSAALAQMGMDREVIHRLWRGQATLLLPLLDMYRLRICAYLEERYGAGWATRWMVPQSEEERAALQESSHYCEWGYLERLLSCCVELDAERHCLPLVRRARRMRNWIAHYRPVAFEDFRALLDEHRRLELVP